MEKEIICACELCKGICEGCLYTEDCSVYNGTGYEVAYVCNGWSVQPPEK